MYREYCVNPARLRYALISHGKAAFDEGDLPGRKAFRGANIVDCVLECPYDRIRCRILCRSWFELAVRSSSAFGAWLHPYQDASKGSKQVAVLGQDDKRHLTLMVTSAMDGTLLPFQAVIKGKTSQSLPKPANRKVAEEWGMFPKCGDKHWGTFQTTKDWVDEIVVRYIEKVKKEKSLQDDQFAILYIDAWAVHRSEAFRDWMREHHPTILLVCVPATCTGVLQPADVGLQRVIKHRLKMSRNPQALFAEWLAKKVGEVKERAKDNGGKTPAKVFSKEVSTLNLRELVPMFMTQAFLAVKSREDLVQKLRGLQL
ncbi:hypothetical protein QFC20_005604 [Naganishia adeliensis]|uniref:Uncharacterized protein n=1 Tax=Naganishia adeliensis TaxID=92952 RepID=A0ACC2VKU3_9TREE|nr:hypothetical protein QFC20_005604 [Naganishia adeliensis]